MPQNKLYVLFKTHLDIGFTDFSANVVSKYMDSFIPGALRVADELQKKNGDARLIWTCGSWLIAEYLRTHKGREKEALENGIKKGNIRWHGLPFTTHTELMDAHLFEYGLSLSESLDKAFGRKTIAAKMTDVPGHTRAIIPYLKKHGIEFLHIGVNPASAMPDVPPVFKWRAETGETINVMYQKDYGSFTEIGDTGAALHFAHTGDNAGVQSAEQIEAVFSELKEKLPDKKIVAGDLNDIALEVRKIENTLPIVDCEIGDTWIHGVGTDPKKVSQFKGLLRFCDTLPDGKDKDTLLRGLIMIPEHTWGLDVKKHLADHEHYKKTEFITARRLKDNYFRMEASWREQRNYLYDAVSLLSPALREKADAVLRESTRPPLDTAGLKKIKPGEKTVLGKFTLSFNEKGEIVHLTYGDRQLASDKNRLLSIIYEQFSFDDYKRFFEQYIRLNVSWSREDFTKVGMDKAKAKKVSFTPVATVFGNADKITVKYVFPDTAAKHYGCPKRFDLTVTADGKRLMLDLAWFNKSANRIAEAIWLGFDPTANGKRISKLGEEINVKNIAKRGQSHLHATDRGVIYDEIEIESLDAALVSPDKPSLLDFNDILPKDGAPVYFNLYNNIWGTNFPMWYDEDARFRFNISVND